MGMALSGFFGTELAEAGCEKPISVTDLGRELEAARQSYFLAEFWQALDRLNALEERLGCTSGVISPEDLRSFYALKGTVHLNVEQQPEARKALNRAAVVMPTVEWDQELGNRGKTLFIDLKAAQLTLEPGPLLLSWRGAEGYEIAVDGKKRAKGETLDGLYPGEHFLQYRQSGEGWTGRWVSFPGGPPWIPALTGQGDVVVQQADGRAGTGLKSHIRWKPGLYIAGGSALLAAGSGVVSLVSSAQASTLLENLGTDETLPDSYDTYATRANVGTGLAIGFGATAVISTGLAFFMPTHKGSVAAVLQPGPSGVTMTLAWSW